MESMVRFAHPHTFYALAAAPLLILIYLWSRRMRARSLQRFGNPRLLQQLMPDAGKRKPGIKFALLLMSVMLLIVALANPQIGTKLETVKREGVDILICLDISNSMKAEDFKPNRLENAKRQISLLLQRLQNDRIGIVVFAGAPFLQLPLTTDYSAAQMFLSTIDTDFIPVQGTAIGSAIRLAMKSFVRGERKHRVIIVISDGEDFEEDAVAAAKEAAGDGIVLHTIGMGSPQGVPIPLYENGQPTGFKKDEDGNVVVTRLNEVLMQQVADAGKGKYLRAATRQDELESLFKDIEGMEKKALATRMFTEFEDRFQVPLFAALALLLIEFLVSERKSRWTSTWKSLLPGATRATALSLLLLLAASAHAESERSLVRDGNRLYQSKQYPDAEVNYRKALDKDKKLREGQFNLGDALYKQGRFEEAEKQFRLSGETAPDATSRAQAYHNLGNALLKEKKLEDSIRSYKEALKLNPADSDTKYNLAYAQRLLQQQQQQQKQQQNQDQKKNNKDQKQNQQQNQKQDKQENDKNKQQRQDQQKKDQQKQDQQQNQNKNPQQQQDKQQQERQKEQQQEQQQQKKDQISPQDAERILEALKNEEKNVQKKLHKAVAKSAKVKKDW